MKIIKNFIAQKMTNKNLKWVLIFLVIWGLFIWDVYAQTNTKQTSLDFLTKYLHLIMAMLSWGWIILANLAGKLMTNDIVYGSFLHLDASLWTLRNIMKNFANFALWFLVLFAVVKNVFSIWDSDAGKWKPKDVIIKTVMAGILIQMSWFLMWAVVDLSTIMTSAVWAFPSQFIASNNDMRWAMEKNIRKLEKGRIVFDPKSEEEIVKREPKESLQELDEEWINKMLDSITPSYDSVSWPLLFLGLSVFNFNEFENYAAGWWNENAVTERWDLFLSLGLSAIVLIFFSLMMFLLFLFNLFRIIVLWLVIPLMPIIVLLNVFDFKIEWKTGELLDIKHILMLIFKPVLMVWSLSLVLVMLILIKNVIAKDKVHDIPLTDHGNMTIESTPDGDGLYTSTMKSEWIMEFSMSGTKDTIADIIVYFFWLFLIFFLVKISINKGTGIWFIDDKIDKTFDMMNTMATNLPVIPIGGWTSIKSLKEANFWWAINKVTWIDSSREQESMINERLGITKTQTKGSYVSKIVASVDNAKANTIYTSVKSNVESWNDENPTQKIFSLDIIKEWEKQNPDEA